MSNGVMSGRLLAGLVTGDAPPWAALFDPRRIEPVAEAVPVMRLAAKVAAHFVGDRLRSYADSVDDIGPGQGAVTRIAGERCAVYRDNARGASLAPSERPAGRNPRATPSVRRIRSTHPSDRPHRGAVHRILRSWVPCPRSRSPS
jgi:hypothetical protein